MLMRLFSSWQVEQREFLHETEAYPVSLGSQAYEPRPESAMGKGERSRAETQAHNISSRQKENRGSAKGEVGEDEGAPEEGWLEPEEPAAQEAGFPTKRGFNFDGNGQGCVGHSMRHRKESISVLPQTARTAQDRKSPVCDDAG